MGPGVGASEIDVIYIAAALLGGDDSSIDGLDEHMGRKLVWGIMAHLSICMRLGRGGYSFRFPKK